MSPSTPDNTSPKQTGRVILVTGATGFIGSHLAMNLVQSGKSIRLLVRKVEKLPPELRSSCEIVTGSLESMASLEQAVENVDIVFHCAANVRTWDCWENYHAANVAGVKNLLSAIQKKNPGISRIVHLSSVDAYGFPDKPCDERCLLKESGFGYARSKIQGESIIRQLSEEHSIPYTIMRPGNVIGPGSPFILRIGKELKSGLMLKIDGGKSNAGILYIDNLVQHMIWAAYSAKASNQIYNVRDSYDVNWSDFLKALKTGIHGKGMVISLPYYLADMAARFIELSYRIFAPNKEPLLHGLLVRFFGRTCGHSSSKLHADHDKFIEADFAQAMELSCQWFINQNASSSAES